MVLHGRERGKVPGQLRPLASRRGKVLDRVPQIPCPVQARAAHLRRSSQQRRNDRPFRIGAVACVTQPTSVMLGTSGFGPAHVLSTVLATPGESQLTESAQHTFLSVSQDLRLGYCPLGVFA